MQKKEEKIGLTEIVNSQDSKDFQAMLFDGEVDIDDILASGKFSAVWLWCKMSSLCLYLIYKSVPINKKYTRGFKWNIYFWYIYLVESWLVMMFAWDLLLMFVDWW